MTRFSNTVMISSDVKDVFQYLATMENFTAWNYAIEQIEKLDSNKGVVGSKYHLFREQGIQTFEEIVITAHIPSERLVFEASGNIFSYTMKYELEQQSDGTLLTNKAEIKSTGVKGTMIRMMKTNIKNAVNKNLHVLKNIFESGE